MRANFNIPESHAFPPVPDEFQPVFLVGKTIICASVQLELRAALVIDRDIPKIKRDLRVALWQAMMAGSDKIGTDLFHTPPAGAILP